MKKTIYTPRNFKAAMCRGLGRCVQILTSVTPEEREPYRATVLWGCLHNPAFDTQCEGTRARYMYRLIRCYDAPGDADFFLIPLLHAFATCRCTGSWLMTHYIDLLTCFAADGNTQAMQALWDKYDILLKRMRTYKPPEGRPNAVAQDHESLCITLIRLGGMRAFRRVAGDLASLLQVNPVYDLDFWYDWFRMVADRKFGTARAADVWRAVGIRFGETPTDASATPTDEGATPTPSAPDTAETLLEIYHREGRLTLGRLIRFERCAAVEEKCRLAKALFSTSDGDPDPNQPAALTQPDAQEILSKADLFCHLGEYLPPEQWFHLTYDKDAAVREVTMEALVRHGGEAARRRGRELWADGGRDALTIRLLLAGFDGQHQDAERITNALSALRIDYNETSGWHRVILDILEVFERKDGIRRPRGWLAFIYERSLCSCCRENALRIMATHRWLTEEMVTECLYDSNDDIRRLASRKRIRTSIPHRPGAGI